ncbi:helix-turn-helix domain-containing protein [Vibrio vulnificus]|uniref:helix-turn-helix domain-containing protein n=1 Tax=Vibrio vulnificus TaxID=672 RepID=UPI002936A6E4|nr:helix-turn-helix domain-containing protein [Vibrio vulnificus]
MSQLFNPDKKFTQSDVAELLGISDRQVRNLINKGVLPAAIGKQGMNPLACIHGYAAYLRQSNTVEKDPETDREDEETFAKLERDLKLEEKREKIFMMRAKRVLFEKSYAPLDVIIDALEQVAARISTRLDTLLPKLKNAWPDLPPEAVEVLETVIAAVLNECADVQPNLSDYMDGNPEEGPEWLSGTEENGSY